MIIIPAIDILDNEAVRLLKGDYSQKTVYSTKPWELVQGFNRNGADLIHIVDLNGARRADSTNKDCIVRIRKEANVKIQLGGGIRDMEKLKYYESLGIDKFILGTSAVNDPKFVDDALAFIGTDRIIISVDALDGVVVGGWWGCWSVECGDFAGGSAGFGVVAGFGISPIVLVMTAAAP